MTRVRQLVAAAVTAPLGGVELDPLDLVLSGHRLQRIQTRFTIARIKRAVQNDALGRPILHLGILLDGVEAVLVEIRQVGAL